MQEIEKQEERVRLSFPATHRNYLGCCVSEVSLDINNGLFPILERRSDFCDHEIAIFDIRSASELSQWLGREFRYANPTQRDLIHREERNFVAILRKVETARLCGEVEPPSNGAKFPIGRKLEFFDLHTPIFSRISFSALPVSRASASTFAKASADRSMTGGRVFQPAM